MRVPFRVVNTLNLSHPAVGVKGGIPFAKGDVMPGRRFRVLDPSGGEVPAQVNITGYWPDGSIKWVLVVMTVPVEPNGHGLFHLEVCDAGQALEPSFHTKLAAHETGDAIHIDTGVIAFTISRRTANLFQTVTSSGHRSPCVYLAAPDHAGLFIEILRGDSPRSGERVRFEANSDASTFSASLEESGAERAVVMLRGTHRSREGEAYGDYTLRLYAHAGSSRIGLVHSLVFTGDPMRDFVTAVGVRFRGGLPGVGSYTLGGERNGFTTTHNTDERFPVWRRAVLSQDSCLHYSMKKWVDPVRNRPVTMCEGMRSLGWGSIKSPEARISTGIRNFWQENPKAIEINPEACELIAYLYSPYAEPLDLRRYSDKVYRELYETPSKNMPWFDPAYGAQHIGKTSELFLDFSDSQTENITAREALFFQTPPLLTPGGAWIAKTRVFGDFATHAEVAEEPATRRLRATADFLLAEQEFRKWYSFIDHGDLMHSYDPKRDTWRFDEGGYAWLNNEFMMVEAVWTAYLFTDDPRLFRLAEAMTRHTSDVDMYHKGRLAGHGIRHNVNHWGCMDKERRMTIPQHKRMFYFLTGDEHTRDLVHLIYETLCNERDVKEAMDLGVGGYALLFLWETTGEQRYGDLLREMTENYCRQRINGKAFPYWLKFNFRTGEGGHESDTPHPAWFLLMFGPMHILLDSVALTGSEATRQAVLEWASLLHLPPDELHAIQPHTPSASHKSGLEMVLLIAAYAYRRTGDPRFHDCLVNALANPIGRWETRGGDSPLEPERHLVFINPDRDTHQIGVPMMTALAYYPYVLSALRQR